MVGEYQVIAVVTMVTCPSEIDISNSYRHHPVDAVIATLALSGSNRTQTLDFVGGFVYVETGLLVGY